MGEWVEVDDGANAEGAEAQARAFFAECMALLIESAEATKSLMPEPLQRLDARARALQPAARRIGGGWAADFAHAVQAEIGSTLSLVRGLQLMQQWRHLRAKEAFVACSEAVQRYNRLMTDTWPRLPAIDGIAEYVPLLRRSIEVKREVTPLFKSYETQCDIELLLLQGRLGEYVAACRAGADEAARASEALLSAAGDIPFLETASAQLRAAAENMRARSDAVEQLQANRPLYQPPTGDKVFIIHGHAEDKRRELQALLEGRLGLKGRVIVLKDEAEEGQTVIAKFERHAHECCYAIALVTPDDAVKKKAGKAGGDCLQPRPNVLFEMGWFYGRFGPRRMCMLRRAGTELPSDLGGVIALDFVDDVEEKFLRLEAELRKAGVLGAAAGSGSSP